MVGVTGSAGKTTTKDVIAAVLGASMRSARRSATSTITLACHSRCCGFPQEAQVAVLEYGMNHAGEIRALGRIAPPDVAVVTNVGYAHIENFESIDDDRRREARTRRSVEAGRHCRSERRRRTRPAVQGTATPSTTACRKRRTSNSAPTAFASG